MIYHTQDSCIHIYTHKLIYVCVLTEKEMTTYSANAF